MSVALVEKRMIRVAPLMANRPLGRTATRTTRAAAARALTRDENELELL